MDRDESYTSQEVKGALLHTLDQNEPIVQAAKELKINIKTARGIKRRADQISDSHSPSTLHIRAQNALKTGRPKVLSELDLNALDKGIGMDKVHRHMPEYAVAVELALPGSDTTIRRAKKKLRYSWCEPTRKPWLPDTQETIRYEVAYSRKEYWEGGQYRLIAYSDEALILVGEHRGKDKLNRKLEEEYYSNYIEPKFIHYSSTMF